MSAPAHARGRLKLALVLTLLALAPALHAHAESFEAIPLQHRLAEELLPILQPLLPAGAAMTGTGDVLLVRGDAATLQRLREAIATLDRPPRQLMITVGQRTTGTAASASVRGSATIDAGDVQVGVNRPPSQASGARVAVQAGREQLELRDVASVRALEGRETFVALTTTRPYSTVHGGSQRAAQVHTVGRQDAHTGFLATPRLHGDQVTLEISSSQQRLGSAGHDPGVATQSLTTTVSGRLGEWIELGGVTATHADGSAGIVVWGARSELTQYSAWVKVEEVR